MYKMPLLLNNKTLVELMRGGYTTNEFIFSLILVLLGIFIYTLVRILKRKDKDTKASFSVWISHKNNKLELLLSLVIVYPQIIFSTVYEHWIIKVLETVFNAEGAFQLAPFFVMFAGGYLQHYGVVKLIKITK